MKDFWEITELIAYTACWILLLINLLTKGDMLSAIFWLLLIMKTDIKHYIKDSHS